uniref:NADH-ubiquinone oxidoreductase chain 6 n=1 Tax=Tanystylum sp. JZ-2022 TaxID=2992008 RepID=A0A9E8AE64_9CHEL|nr:NADH dehydrogenase subunit 6 [Tanystylum sp. JZ-2022]
MMTSMMILSMLFMLTKNPLMMIMIIILQTLNISLMTSYFNKSFFTSYVLILIFLGGMLVIFIYMASLSSNEKINLNFKWLSITSLSTALLTIPLMKSSTPFTKSSMHLNFMSNDLTSSITKIYNNMIPLTMIMAAYLMITLFVIVKTSKFHKGPIRKK